MLNTLCKLRLITLYFKHTKVKTISYLGLGLSLSLFNWPGYELLNFCVFRQSVVNEILTLFSFVFFCIAREDATLHSPSNPALMGNKWRGVTISLRMGGQGHPTPIHTPCPSHKHKKNHQKRSISYFLTRVHRPTDQQMDGQSLL